MIEIRRDDPRYPPLLAEMPWPPGSLWIQGDPALLRRTAVAIVGSRAATRLGIEMTERLAAGLADRGLVIVSGCAHGIDAAAHKAALLAGGATVAVLGGGLDVAAPPSTRGLARRIAREGCLVSEHPAGVPPLKHHFPLRNRIIAGLSRAVIVVEAAAKSGALITADHATKAGREVLAVPGHPLLPNAAGVNRLLLDGSPPALSVEGVVRVLSELPPVDGVEPWSPEPVWEPAPDTSGLDDFRVRLLAAIPQRPESAESLAERMGAAVPLVLASLTELELLGLVRNHPGQRYERLGPDEV